VLYFFHGKEAAILSHGLVKQQAKVPEKEIELALRRKNAFEVDPKRRTYGE
jgi:phage-related protein